MPDFIPRPDNDFQTWVINCAGIVSGAPTTYGLTSGEGTGLMTAYSEWYESFNAYKSAETAYHDARIVKDGKRATLETLLRAANAIAQAKTGMTPEILGAAGFPVHSDVHGHAVVVPPSAPEIEIQHRETQKLRIVFREAGAGGGAQGRGKPEGVRSCEIWVKLGAPAPANDPDWSFQQAAQRSPAEMNFAQGDIGKTIWIRARWINTRGEPGPWCLAQNTVIA